jgi:class 3 adenylate cyclase
VALALPGSPWLVNGIGIIVSLEVLSAAACEFAGLTVVAAGSRARLVALNVQAMRMARAADGPFTARGSVIHAGRTFVRVATAVQDAGGRVIGHAIGALAVESLKMPSHTVATTTSTVRYDGPDPAERPPPDDEMPMGVWEERTPLDVFHAISTGELPAPNLNRLLGLRHLDTAAGTATVSITASPWFSLQDETVDPAILNIVGAYLSGAAVMSLGTRDRIGGELNRAVAFERPIVADGRGIIMRARTGLSGAKLMVCDVEISDPDGNIAAIEQAVWLLVKRRQATPATPDVQRTLATVLFTDIVASTERAAARGDAGWHDLLAAHREVVRQQLTIFRGHEINTTGDGFLTTFDSPARAVQCARAIRDRIQPSGLQIRAAVHTGELERSMDDVTGIAVHIASRILAVCAANEILVSGTVRDLTTGSGLRLEARGAHRLKGLDDEWRLFAVRD